MMPIVIGVVVLVILAIVALMASQKFRNYVLDALGGTWDLIVANRPAGTSIQTILRPIGWTLFGLFMLMIISWIAFFALMLYLGIKADAVGSAIIIAFLFPAWCVLRIFKPRILPGPPRRNIIWRFLGVPYRFASVALVIALPFFLLGVLLSMKGSTGRIARNAKQGIANSMDERSSKSERESGKFALVRENAVLTDSAVGGNPVGEVTVGMVVRVLDLNTERIASDEAEGKLRVMRPNKFMGYDQGQTGYIPTRALDFEWERKYSTAMAFSDPPRCLYENPRTGDCQIWYNGKRKL